MGLLDNLIKGIASGDLDKKLEKFADTVEHLSGKMDTSVKKLADQPADVTKKINLIGQEAKKNIDIIKK